MRIAPGVGRSTVWVYEWDALGVPSLVRYRVAST